MYAMWDCQIGRRDVCREKEAGEEAFPFLRGLPNFFVKRILFFSLCEERLQLKNAKLTTPCYLRLLFLNYSISFSPSTLSIASLSFTALEAQKKVGEMEKGGFRLSAVMSPEIVEISEETSVGSFGKDVYVAVGKDDLNTLRWALENIVSPGTSVFLIHVFPPITHIPSPVGRLAKSQVSEDQWKGYVNQEQIRRRNILSNYIRLCTDFKVTVDTVLIESSLTAKAIVELIPVLNITKLVMGARRASPRRLKKGLRKSEFVQNNAPEFCEIMIICDGNNIAKKLDMRPKSSSPVPRSRSTEGEGGRQPERNFFECTCFSGRFVESEL